MIRRALVVVFLCGSALGVRAAGAGEGPAVGAPPPSDNSSYVPDDRDAVKRDWATALAAIESKNFTEAVRALQRIVGGPADAVIPAGEPGVFDGADIAAHQRVVASGAACLDAYEHEFGPAASNALARAVAARDEGLLAAVMTTYRPSAAGRQAALLLADLAVERADADAALGFLEGLEDLEDVAAADLSQPVATWRAARLPRKAAALARDAAAAGRIMKRWIEGPDAPLDRADLALPPASNDWPTTGGDAARSAVSPPLGARLRHASSEWLGVGTPLDPPWGSSENPDRSPSLWIPTRAVVSAGRIFVSDGRALRVFEADTGRFAASLPLSEGDTEDARPPPPGRPSRKRFGWIEGHGLTVDGDRIYATRAGDWDRVEFERERERARRELERERKQDGEPVDPAPPAPLPPGPGPVPPPGPGPVPLLGPDAPPVPGSQAADAASPHDRVVALDWSGGRLTRRWEAGGGVATPRLPAGMRLYGTPLVYRGRIHVAGLRPTIASSDRIEAWHVSLDPATGRVESATLLGAGGPVRAGRDDEAMPASCAAAHGRVVVVTSLGIAAAVDATTGRTIWSCRYDRGRPDGDDLGHRLDATIETTERRSSFVNEPPVIADGRCFLTPTDARYVFAIADRPRGRARALRLWQRHRVDDFRNLAVEQVVGVVGAAYADTPMLVLAGQGYEGEGSPHTAVVGLDPATGELRWERALPFATRPEPYGRALVTTDEVYVSTENGIARYRVKDGEEIPLLDGASVQRDGGSLEDAYGRRYEPIGNLIPIPGKGIVAVNADSISIWRTPD